jgi:hypothetical protein
MHPPRGFASRLDRGQQQGDQHGNDRDDDQKLDQGETATPLHNKSTSSTRIGQQEDSSS